MKILLNILTHGDERIGLKVAQEIQRFKIDKNLFSVQIANQKAYKKNKRFIHQDLNRSFPGKKTGNHEETLAYKLTPLIKSADLVIDIHSTLCNLKDAIIVTKLDTATKRCLEAIQPKYVLVMNATKNNALISQAKIGIAFEYGQDNDPKNLEKMVKDIKRLFVHLGLVKQPLRKRNRAIKYFNVTSEVAKPKGYQLLKDIKSYKLVRKSEAYATNNKNTLMANLVAQEDFYPILFGDSNYETIFGFMAKKISGLA